MKLKFVMADQEKNYEPPAGSQPLFTEEQLLAIQAVAQESQTTTAQMVPNEGETITEARLAAIQAAVQEVHKSANWSNANSEDKNSGK